MDDNETRAILEEEIVKMENSELENSNEARLPSEPTAEMIKYQEKIANDNIEKYTQEVPQSFDEKLAENFKKLPPDLKQQLWEHEKKREADLAKLDNQLQKQKWLDEIIQTQEERLESLGIMSAEDYIKNLVQIDTLLEKNPQATLQYLAKVYGTKISSQPQSVLQAPQINVNSDNIQKSLLENNEKRLTSPFAANGTSEVIREIRMQKAWNEISRFMAAVNEEGECLHPYIEDVKPQMLALLEKRAADTLEDAYQKALWLTPRTREQLIHKKAQDMLQKRVAEAEKAKVASFAPQGKLSKTDMGSLSTRELLMKLIDE